MSVRRSGLPVKHWPETPSRFDIPQCIIYLTDLYTNYKHTGLWDKTVPNQKAQLIALATHFKDNMDSEKSTRKKKPSKSNPAATQRGARKLGRWIFEDVGPTMRGPDKKNYAWCPLHGHKTDGVHNGMYMPAPHNHEVWQAGKDAKLNPQKEQKEGRSPTNHKAPVEPTAKPSAKKGNLRRSNSFKSTLCTQMMTSDKEADDFVNAIMRAAELSDKSDEEPLKEQVRSTQVVYQWIN